MVSCEMTMGKLNTIKCPECVGERVTACSKSVIRGDDQYRSIS